MCEEETVAICVGDEDSAVVSDCTTEGVTSGELDDDSECDADTDCEAEDEGEGALEELSDPEAESDATDGEAVGVDPAGSQNGPMLNVARCVPSME